jgi:hypothetical protein
MTFGMGISFAVAGAGVIADALRHLAAAGPPADGRLPCFDETILWFDLPFLRALGLDGPVSFALQNPHFNHSSSPSPFETPY